MLCASAQSTLARNHLKGFLRIPLRSPPSRGAPAAAVTLGQPSPAPGRPPRGSDCDRESSLSQHRKAQSGNAQEGSMGSSNSLNLPKSPLREIPTNQRSHSFNKRGRTNEHFVSIDGMRRRSLGKAEGEECLTQYPPGSSEIRGAVEPSHSQAVPSFRTSSTSLTHQPREEVAQQWAQPSPEPLRRDANGSTSSFLETLQDQAAQTAHSVHSGQPAQTPSEVEKGHGGGSGGAVATDAGARRTSAEVAPPLWAAWKQQIVNSFMVRHPYRPTSHCMGWNCTGTTPWIRKFKS